MYKRQVSRLGDEPTFIAGDFLKFVVRAWENESTPYFLCLDEMNLAPVEQYFAAVSYTHLIDHERKVRGWGSERSYFLAALRGECEKRGIDYC